MTSILAGLHKGAWSMTHDDSSDVVVPSDLPIVGHEIMMVFLPTVRAMRPGAVRFSNAVDVSRAEHVYSMAVVHMMLKLASTVRSSLYKAGAGQEEHSDPVAVYLETVVGSDARVDPLDNETFGNTPEVVAQRLFMRGIEDARPVEEYRLWFVVRKCPGADFGTLFFDTISQLREVYEENFGGNGPVDDKKGASRRVDDAISSAMQTYSEKGNATAGDQYGRSIDANELWRHFRSLELWARTIDMMYGLHSFSRRPIIEYAESVLKSPDKNPLHPRYTLSPRRYFQHPNEHAHPKQAAFASYFPNGAQTQLHFPFPNCVLRIDTDDLLVARFMHKLVPDYQARCIGEALSKEAALKLQPPRLSEAYLARLERERDEARGRRAMVHVDLDGANDMMDDSFDFDDDPAHETPEGGTTSAAVDAMLKWVPVTNDDGALELADARLLERNDFEGDEAFRGEATLRGYDGPERSRFHFVRAIGQQLHGELMKSSETETDRAINRKNYVRVQRRVARLYEDECSEHTSDISQVGKKINGWLLQQKVEGDGWIGIEAPLIDPTMSFFANSLARRSMRFEHGMYVTTTQKLALTMSYALLDAYRHVLDLHYYFMVCGRHETSKSFTLDVLEQLFIPGTTEQITSSSAQAEAIDIDMNDIIGFAHETRESKFTEGKAGDKGNTNDSENQSKEVLGKALCKRKVFHTSKCGRREQRNVVSQRMQTHVYLSNRKQSFFSKAIQSRMSCLAAEERVRTDKSTAELATVDLTASAVSLMRANHFMHEMRAAQALHYHTEKLIAVAALADVSTTCYDVLSQTFLANMHARHSIQVLPRTMKRINMLIRQFVISRATMLLYSSPHSKYYRRPFQIRHLLDLDPLLYDSAEMFEAAVDMHRHELLPVARTRVLKALEHTFLDPVLHACAPFDDENEEEGEPRDSGVAALMERTEHTTQARANFLTPETAIRRHQHSAPAAPPAHSRELSEPRRPLGKRMRDGAAPPAMATREEVASQVYTERHMYAYLMIAKRRREVSAAVEAATSGSDQVLHADDVDEQLRALLNVVIRGRKYTWDDTANRPFAQNEPQLHDKPFVSAAIQTLDAFFIHLDLLENRLDPIDDSLDKCLSAIAPHDSGVPRVAERTYKHITGLQMEGDFPYLLKTRTRTYSADRQPLTYKRHADAVSRTTLLAFPHMAADTTGRYRVTDAREKLAMHVDDLARRERAKTLFLDPDVDGAVDGVCSIAPHERKMREGGQFVMKEACDYPAALM